MWRYRRSAAALGLDEFHFSGNGFSGDLPLPRQFTRQIPASITMELMVGELLASAFEVAQHSKPDMRVAALLADCASADSS